MEKYLDRYCFDLATHPATDHKVLVTGSTGYIGGELIPELVARGYRVRVMVRRDLAEYRKRWPSVEIVVADVMDYQQLKIALEGIDCAYYLIHALHIAKDFKKIDNQSALNFQRAAEEQGLKRIIYLGSLGNLETPLSDHLTSRLTVAEDLRQGKTPVTFLRAAVIIGSGSASYRIINHLVKNCPFFVFPIWAGSKCQPIAIRDVIKYLVGCLENEETTGKVLDIGGPDVLTYRQMLRIQARVLNKRRIFINGRLSMMGTYIKVTSLLTPLPSNLIKALMESCLNDVICLDKSISRMIPFKTLSYTESLERAMSRESQMDIFKKKKALFKSGLALEKGVGLHPPNRSRGIFSDIRYFILHKPEIPTMINFDTVAERENYSYRIMQRLGIEVDEYRILNIHKIGVNAPAKYIFEELLKWNGDSTCWPNFIAKVVKRNNRLENLLVYLFGWTKFPAWIKNSVLGRTFIPLFELNAIAIKKIPDPSGSDNARYMLYRCSGGYPIGVFTMYVRSSIANQEELEQSQLFMMVGFNFYGREQWSKRNFVSRLWEMIHDRVTSNVLGRLKQLSESRFEKLKLG